jgi:hypothetical protein
MNPAVSHEFLFDAGQNRLLVTIDSKPVLVKCRTLHQLDQYDELQKRNEEKAKPVQPAGDAPKEKANEKRSTVDILRESLESHLDYAVIALNPDPGRMDFPRETIRTKLDPDRVQLLAEKWLERFLRPQLVRDPTLPPAAGVR